MVKCTSLDSLIVYCDIIIIIIMDLNKVKQVEFSRRMAAEMLTYFFFNYNVFHQTSMFCAQLTCCQWWNGEKCVA